MNETHSRSIIKTLIWRLTGSGATFLISYFLTKDFSVSGTIAVIQIVVNTLLYYLYERVWNKIHWGRK